MFNGYLRKQLNVKKLMAMSLIAISPLLMGVTTWSVSYPGTNSTIYNQGISGTGQAPTEDPPGSEVGNQVTFKITTSAGVEIDKANGTVYEGGGWYITIAGPIATGTNRDARIYKGGVSKAKNTGITIIRP